MGITSGVGSACGDMQILEHMQGGEQVSMHTNMKYNQGRTMAPQQSPLPHDTAHGVQIDLVMQSTSTAVPLWANQQIPRAPVRDPEDEGPPKGWGLYCS